jgi:cation diffusion facilitator family transporter
MIEHARDDQGLAQQRTTVVSIVAAAFLVALKLGAGLIVGSLALISAGIESSGDVVAAVLTFFAVRLGRRPADREHPYGHRRAENLGALGEAAILLVGALVVAAEAIHRLASGAGPPSTSAALFAVVAVALIVDLSRTIVSLRVARRYDSAALRSNALHFAGDAASSVAVLAGLLLVRSGVDQADTIAALVIAAIILVGAFRLINENANVLMDRSPAAAREAAERALAGLGPDIELRRLRLRESAGRYFVDVVAAVPPGEAVVEGHRTADLIERTVGRALPESDVVVHVEPRRSGLDPRQHVLAIALAEPLVCEAHDVTLFEHNDSTSVSLHLKFPAELDLETAHAVAQRIERAIRATPGVAEVQTHLEPLERPLVVDSAKPDRRELSEIERLVGARRGLKVLALRMVPTEVGKVLFLTVKLGDGASLKDAHALAGEIEEQLRSRIGGIADVVIHTEP